VLIATRPASSVDPGCWFGDYRPPRSSATPERVRRAVRERVADTGMRPQGVVPAAPLTLPQSSYAELFRAAHGLLGLVHRTVLQAGRTYADRVAAYGAEPDDRGMLMPDPWQEELYAAAVARPDVVIGPQGPQFIEFNPSGAVCGPVEIHCLLQAWRRLGHVDDVPRYGSHDPFEARSRLFDDVCRHWSVPRQIALVGSVRDLKHTSASRFFDLEVNHLRARGFVAEFFEPEELLEALGDGPGVRFPVGLRCFTLPEWDALGISLEPIAAALARGCLLLPTQTASLLDNKKTIGMLSEGMPWMSHAEQRLVDRYIPWTRVLTDRRTHRGEGEVELARFALEAQEELVLKRGVGMQGQQVLVGRQETVTRWEVAINVAVETGDSVLQEYVSPVTCEVDVSVDDTGEVHRVRVPPVLSPLLCGGHAGGVWARYFVGDDDAVVSRDGNGASENAVVAVRG
jgi:hypothetical protein